MPRNVVYYSEFVNPYGHTSRMEIIPADATSTIADPPTYVRIPEGCVVEIDGHKTSLGDLYVGFREGETLSVKIRDFGSLPVDLQDYLTNPIGPAFDSSAIEASPASYIGSWDAWYYACYQKNVTTNLWTLSTDYGDGGGPIVQFVGVQRVSPPPKGRRFTKYDRSFGIEKEFVLVDAFKVAIEEIRKVRAAFYDPEETPKDNGLTGYAWLGYEAESKPRFLTFAGRGVANSEEHRIACEGDPMHGSAVDARYYATGEAPDLVKTVRADWIYKAIANCVSAWFAKHTRHNSTECLWSVMLPYKFYSQNWNTVINGGEGYERIGTGQYFAAFGLSVPFSGPKGYGQFGALSGKHTINGCPSKWDWLKEDAEAHFRKVSRRAARYANSTRLGLALEDVKLYDSRVSHSTAVMEEVTGYEWEEQTRYIRAANAALNAAAREDVREFKYEKAGSFADDEANAKFSIHNVPPVIDADRFAVEGVAFLSSFPLPDYVFVHSVYDVLTRDGAFVDALAIPHGSAGIDLGGAVGVVDFHTPTVAPFWLYSYDTQFGGYSYLKTNGIAERVAMKEEQARNTIPKHVVTLLVDRFSDPNVLTYEMEIAQNPEINGTNVGDIFTVPRPDDTLYANVSEYAVLIECDTNYKTGRTKVKFCTVPNGAIV